MKELKGNLTTMYILIVVWLLSVLFSAVMFTIALIYDVFSSLIISGITGVLSSIGIFYTGYIITKINMRISNIDK